MRERRLRSVFNTQQSIRTYETAAGCAREENKGKVVGRLSVIVAPRKRGDIVVRETDLEKEKGLEMLVKNFVICYGLKK